MSKQLRFFVVRNDLNDLMQFAEQIGFRAIPQVVKTDSTPVDCPPTKFEPNSEAGMGFFYLLPKGFAVVEAFYSELEFEPGRSKLPSRASPVIEVSPGKVGSSVPVEGRIYHCQDQSDPRYKEASTAYEQLRQFVEDQWVRTANGKFYFGSHAARLCRLGKAEVSCGGKRLELAPE